MNQNDPMSELRALLDEIGDGPADPSLGVELLVAAGDPAAPEALSSELRTRLEAALGPGAAGLVGAALEEADRARQDADDELGDPLRNPTLEGQRALLEALDARDRLERAERGTARLGLAALEEVRSGRERLDDELRDLLDRTLRFTPLRRETAPAEPRGWWWDYRLECDAELLGRTSAGSASPADRERLERHLATCEACRDELLADEAADVLLRRGAAGLAGSCPGPDELDRLARGELPPADARSLAYHLDLCVSCCEAVRAGPRLRRREPARGLARLGERVAADRYALAFASEGPEAPLEPLLALERLTGSPPPQGLDLAVTRVDRTTTLLVHAPGLTELRVLRPALDPARPPEHLTTLGLVDGLFRLELSGEPDSGAWLLDLGPAGTRVVDLELDQLRPEPDPDLDAVVQALRLSSPLLAAELLDTHARRLAPGVRRQLALEAAASIRAAREGSAAPPARVGVARTLAAWRGRGGICEVVAPEHPLPGGSEDASGFERALEDGWRYGELAARRALGLEGDVKPGIPELRPALELTGLTGEGASLGLAAAVAAYSRRLDLPVPGDLLMTGVLDPATGEVLPVQGGSVLAEKLGAAARECPRARVLYPRAQSGDVPEPLRAALDLVPVALFSEAIEHALGQAHLQQASQDELLARLSQAFDAERAYDFGRAIDLAQSVASIPGATPRQRLRASWIVGACLVHQGRPEDAGRSFEEARALVAELEASDSLEFSDLIYLAMAEADRLADTFEFEQALARLDQARRWAPSDELRAKHSGLRGLVLHYAGRHAEAVSAADDALRRAEQPLDRARFHCWRALARTALGQRAEALRDVEEGLELCRAVRPPRERPQVAYLLRARARLELSRGEPEAALESARQALETWGPRRGYPWPSLQHLQGRALLELGRPDVGLQELEAVRSELAGSELSPFGRLACSLALLERAAWLVEHERPEAAEALADARSRIEGYEPARRRFAAELADLDRPGPSAAAALRRVLEALPY